MPGSPATRNRRPRPDHASPRAASSAAFSASRPTKGSAPTAESLDQPGKEDTRCSAPARMRVGRGRGRERVELVASAASTCARAAAAAPGMPPFERTMPRAFSSSIPSIGRPEQVAELAAGGRVVRQGHEHRQGVDALEEVVPGRLAELGFARGEVEDVVDDLERGAEPQAVASSPRRRASRSCPATSAPMRAAVAKSADVLPSTEA